MNKKIFIISIVAGLTWFLVFSLIESLSCGYTPYLLSNMLGLSIFYWSLPILISVPDVFIFISALAVSATVFYWWHKKLVIFIALILGAIIFTAYFYRLGIGINCNPL